MITFIFLPPHCEGSPPKWRLLLDLKNCLKFFREGSWYVASEYSFSTYLSTMQTMQFPAQINYAIFGLGSRRGKNYNKGKGHSKNYTSIINECPNYLCWMKSNVLSSGLNNTKTLGPLIVLFTSMSAVLHLPFLADHWLRQVCLQLGKCGELFLSNVRPIFWLKVDQFILVPTPKALAFISDTSTFYVHISFTVLYGCWQFYLLYNLM